MLLATSTGANATAQPNTGGTSSPEGLTSQGPDDTSTARHHDTEAPLTAPTETADSQLAAVETAPEDALTAEAPPAPAPVEEPKATPPQPVAEELNEQDAAQADTEEADTEEADTEEADPQSPVEDTSEAQEPAAPEAIAADPQSPAASPAASTQQPTKPRVLRVQGRNIPKGLKAHRSFVLWRLEFRNGRWTKVPCQANGAPAKANDPRTWTDYGSAWSAYERGGFDGIGFVMSKDDGMVAVDIDGCRDPETGAINADSQEIVARCASYADASPSGTGIRIFLRGEWGPGRSVQAPWKKGDEKAEIEVADNVKYFTMTGHMIEGTPPEPQDGQEALDWLRDTYFTVEPKPVRKVAGAPGQTTRSALTDTEVLDKAKAAKNGAEFCKLSKGDTSSYGGDHSAAVMALTCMLTFWTGGNPEQIDRLLRQSGLMRSKWDERHRSDGATYGQMTIERAIALCEETYTPGGAGGGSAGSDELDLLGPSATDFPDLSAEDIPAPMGQNPKGEAAYGSRQIVQLLYPDWTVTALDTNAAHSERIRTYLGQSLRYCEGLGWMRYNGKYWERDGKRDNPLTATLATRLSRRVRAEANQLYVLAGRLAEAGSAEEAEALKSAAREHAKHARKVEERKFVEDTLKFAAGNPGLCISVDVFDQKAWLLGFDNGVWHAGEWREHRREDFLLRVSPVVFDPDADRSEWLGVLDRMTGGDPELARTLQDVAGYVFSGAPHLRCLPWPYGPKGTGKSTYAELLQTVLGKNAMSVDPRKLHGSAPRERLGADLWNRRLAVCAEAGSQKTGSPMIEAELLKTLSGGDMLTVRMLYHEAFDAIPSHVLLLVSNDPPRLDAYDEALKDRVMALPFVHPLNQPTEFTLTGGARIEAVRKEPASPLVMGFTAWALEGMARLQESSEIFRAPVVEEACARFWEETDPLTPFWETVAIDDLIAGIPKAELRKRYEWWCDMEGAGRPFGPKVWARACESMGLVEVRKSLDPAARDNTRHWTLDPKRRPDAGSNAEDIPSDERLRLNLFGREVCEVKGVGYAKYFPNVHAIPPVSEVDLNQLLNN